MQRDMESDRRQTYGETERDREKSERQREKERWTNKLRGDREQPERQAETDRQIYMYIHTEIKEKFSDADRQTRR